MKNAQSNKKKTNHIIKLTNEDIIFALKVTKKGLILWYIERNNYLCNAFAQSLSGEELPDMLRCNDKQFNNRHNGFN